MAIRLESELNLVPNRSEAVALSRVNEIEWHENVHPAEWDSAVAALRGHPLQSALWGSARRAADGIQDHRWMAMRQGQPIWMVRIEERRVPGLGCIAWAPKGPTGDLPGSTECLPPALTERLKGLGSTLLVTDPWKDVSTETADLANRSALPKTIWIDMGAGRDFVWNNLEKQWRYGVRRAERLGVVVETTRSISDIENFYALCTNISQSQGLSASGIH